MHDSIESRRLSLRTLGMPVLETLLAGERGAAERLLDCQIPADLPLDEMPLARRLAQLQQHADHEPWLLRGIVQRTANLLIGHIGFHTPPGPEYLSAIAPDGVEFGYSVHQPFRRQGFAREAALAVMHWAYTNHGQRTFVLSIGPQNEPSTNLAHSLGFIPCGSHIDEEDGLEIEYLLRLEHWPSDWSS